MCGGVMRRPSDSHERRGRLIDARAECGAGTLINGVCSQID